MLTLPPATPFEALVAESARVGWPKHYRNDLFVYDKELLEKHWPARFVWLLRKSGSAGAAPSPLQKPRTHPASGAGSEKACGRPPPKVQSTITTSAARCRVISTGRLVALGVDPYPGRVARALWSIPAHRWVRPALPDRPAVA